MPSPRSGGPDREDPLVAIERGELDPIYCLHGTERFLVDRCLGAIRTAILGSATASASFNADFFDLKETSALAVLAAARTLPLFATGPLKLRLVVAKGVDQVKAEVLEPLIPYIADPNPSSCLVLVGDKIDTRFKVFSALRKAGYLHEFAALRDRELGAWIVREARTRKTALDATPPPPWPRSRARTWDASARRWSSYRCMSAKASASASMTSRPSSPRRASATSSS